VARRVVALVADLMDRSRITASVADVVFTADAAAADGADVVIVDLARHGSAVAAVRAAAPNARVVAYGSHVDDAALERAREHGADLVLARSRFFRDPAAAVAGRS
jgi:DNA-binding NarL/FixJ family response regulator